MLLQASRQFKALPLTIVFLLGIWVFAQAAWAFSISRIIPNGRVEAYSDGQVVQVYTSEAPFPEGHMLKTQGRCGVRLDGFYLVADDQSIFGIRDQNGERMLTIEQGMVYFALSGLPGNLVFQTPAGVFPARQIVIHAAGQGVMKAYLDIQSDQTQIGVLEGGYMVVSTAEGDRKIEPGRQITIAQALLFEEDDPSEGGAAEEQQPKSEEPEEIAKPEEGTPEQPVRKSNTGVYVGVGLGVVAVVGAALALGGGGGGSGSSGGGNGGGNGSVSPVD